MYRVAEKRVAEKRVAEKQGVKVCFHFLKGNCRFGPKCRDFHPEEPPKVLEKLLEQVVGKKTSWVCGNADCFHGSKGCCRFVCPTEAKRATIGQAEPDLQEESDLDVEIPDSIDDLQLDDSSVDSESPRTPPYTPYTGEIPGWNSYMKNYRQKKYNEIIDGVEKTIGLLPDYFGNLDIPVEENARRFLALVSLILRKNEIMIESYESVLLEVVDGSKIDVSVCQYAFDEWKVECPEAVPYIDSKLSCWTDKVSWFNLSCAMNGKFIE